MKIRFSAFQIVMGAWFVLAILGYSFTANNASACSNALIGALAAKQCTSWVAVHDLAIASMWIAGALFVLAIVIEVINKDRNNVERP